MPAQLNNGGYFFQAIARLRPGVSLEQARNAMDVIAAGYREANPANVDAPVADRAGAAARRCGRRPAPELPAALRRGRLRAADRLRQHRQPAAGALRRPAQGDRRPLRARRQSIRRGAPARHREPGRRRARRAARGAARPLDAPRPGRVRGRADSPRAGDRDRSAGARLRPGRDARHRAGHRPAAGAAGDRRERAGGAEGRQPRLHRRRAGACGPACSSPKCRCRSCC